jgi:hypothetical protein
MFLIYNCGYKFTLATQGKVTKKTYFFKKRFVTEVDDNDGKAFLAMTSKDISWCPSDPKNIPPFMTLEDWCEGKEGRMDTKPYKKYDVDQYKKLFLLK